MSSTAMEWKATAREQFESMLLNVELACKAEQEKLTGSIQDGAREQFAVALNLGLRRLRAVTSVGDIANLTVELASSYTEKVAFFLFREGAACAEAMRNLGREPVQFPPNEAAAFQTAIETQDPVVAMGMAPEISSVLAERFGVESAERVFLYPMAVRGEVKAILIAAGNVQPATLEFIAGMAALQMETLAQAFPAQTPANGLVSISGAAVPRKEGWADLNPELQALHLKAQRKARLRIAEMQIEHRQALLRGREKSDLYSELRQPIDQARSEFRQEFLSASPTMVDYLHLELIRGLAQGNERLLGPSFPGPLI